MRRVKRLSCVATFGLAVVGLTKPALALDVARKAVSLNFLDEPKVMDPQKAQDQIAIMILDHCMEGLLRMDPHYTPVPAVAESWVQKGPTEYEFRLRPEARWSDGRPIVAADFAFAWRRAVDPKTASEYAFIMYPVKNAEAINAGKASLESLGVRAIDAHTLEVTLERPTAYFPRLLAFPTYFPARADVVAKYGDSYGADADKLLYNGAFKIVAWQHSASLRMEKNETYWNRDKIQLNEIDMPYLIRDTNSEYNMYKDGKFDLVWSLPKELLPDAEANRLQIKKYNVGAVWYFDLNTTRRVTGNLNIRKALQLAMNRHEFITQVFGIPGAKPAFGMIPDYMPGVKTSYGVEFPTHFKDADVATARQYLAKGLKELGLAALPPITVLSSDTDTAKRDLEYFQRYYKETLGIDLKLDFQTFKVRLERTSRRDFDMVYDAWGPDYLDEMTFADLNTSWNGNNHTGWASQAYDGLIKGAMNTIDMKQRLELFHKADAILIDKAPVLPIYQQSRVYVQDPRLVGVQRNPVGADPDFYYAHIAATVSKSH